MTALQQAMLEVAKEVERERGYVTTELVRDRLTVPLADKTIRRTLWEEVLDARRMPLEEKLILGERLFRWACAVTLAGIRNQNPEADEAECQRILRERIELGKRMGTL